jgi:hypothetical protein
MNESRVSNLRRTPKVVTRKWKTEIDIRDLEDGRVSIFEFRFSNPEDANEKENRGNRRTDGRHGVDRNTLLNEPRQGLVTGRR